MRHSYDLTTQTLKTLTGNVAELAEEMNVSDKYVYGILSGTNTDPFAPFEHMYQAAARAGVSTCQWDNRLAAIKARYEKQRPAVTHVQCLAEKIKTDADTTAKFVEAMSDGKITPHEAEKILRAVAEEREVLDMIETMMQFVTVDHQQPATNGRRVY